MTMIERGLGAFSLAMFGVVTTLFLCVFGGTPMSCGYRASVQLPWASTAKLLPSSEADLEIFIKRDASIYVGPNVVPSAMLSGTVTDIASRSPRRVRVMADGSVPYGVVQDVMRASRAAGFGEVSLVTYHGIAAEAWRKGGRT